MTQRRRMMAAAIVGAALSIVYAALIGKGGGGYSSLTEASVDGVSVRVHEGWQSSFVEWPDMPRDLRGTVAGRAAWWSVGPLNRTGSGLFNEVAFGFPFRSLRKGYHEFGGLETAIELRDETGFHEVFPGSSTLGIPTGVLWRGAIANAAIWAFAFAGVVSVVAHSTGRFPRHRHELS